MCEKDIAYLAETIGQGGVNAYIATHILEYITLVVIVCITLCLILKPRKEDGRK